MTHHAILLYRSSSFFFFFFLAHFLKGASLPKAMATTAREAVCALRESLERGHLTGLARSVRDIERLVSDGGGARKRVQEIGSRCAHVFLECVNLLDNVDTATRPPQRKRLRPAERVADFTSGYGTADRQAKSLAWLSRSEQRQQQYSATTTTTAAATAATAPAPSNNEFRVTPARLST